MDVIETSGRDPYDRDTPQGTGQQKIHPAIQLERRFRKGETTLFSHKDYPFPVVMVSIPDSELRAYIQQHIPVCDKHDYKKLLAAEFSAAEYRAWHEHAV